MNIEKSFRQRIISSVCAASFAALSGAASAATPELVEFPSHDIVDGGGPVSINGYLYKPEGAGATPAVVLFHTCGGVLWKTGKIGARYAELAERITGMGYTVLIPDSFNPRGERSVCGTKPSQRAIQDKHRWLDAYGALAYLNSRSDIVRGKVAAMGHSWGGNTAMQVIDATLPTRRKGDAAFAASVALYPSCNSLLKQKTTFSAAVPLLMLAGDLDEKNPAQPCQELAERSKASGEPVEILTFPGAGHGFDQSKDGHPEAREAAFARVADFFATHLGAGSAVAKEKKSASAKKVADEDINPEAATGLVTQKLVTASRFMTASANPLATEAGDSIQRQGGNAVDAAIATQLVLTLTEPQSSGIGGGAFIVYYDAKSGALKTYDGRETAPAAAQPERFMKGGRALRVQSAINTGQAVGTPGTLRVLELAHKNHGKLPWAKLFEPAIRLAENGFAVSPRLSQLIEKNKELPNQAAAKAYFMPDGAALPVGHILKNPALAQVLRRVAQEGADAFYKGEIARDIVAAVRAHNVPGDITEQDLAGYQVRDREPVCGNYRIYRICGMPPPSSGGVAVLQMLGMLEQHPIAGLKPNTAEAVHYFAEAGRLAYADRDYYMGDPDFVSVPTKALLNPAYLKQRGALIKPDRSMGTAQPGDPEGKLASLGKDDALDIPATSHIVAVDSDGNALSMTTTIESEFGSKIFVRGFLLNNQLTDFSMSPQDKDGKPMANRVQAGKRPRSTMSPMIVFRDGKPYMVVGSPGGSAIINYVAKTLVGVLDWGLDMQEAISLPNMGSRNKNTELEAGTVLESLKPRLEEMGHSVHVMPFPSGVQGIVMKNNGLSGGADPRREGAVKGL